MKKHKKKSVLVLCMILSTTLISTTAYSEASRDHVRLEQNQKAPFSGVLIPDESYRQMAVDVFAKSDFERALANCEATKYEDTSWSDPAIWFLAGLAGGMLFHLR